MFSVSRYMEQVILNYCSTETKPTLCVVGLRDIYRSRLRNADLTSGYQKVKSILN